MAGDRGSGEGKDGIKEGIQEGKEIGCHYKLQMFHITNLGTLQY